MTVANSKKKSSKSKKNIESKDIERVIDAYQFMRREGLSYFEVQESDYKLVIKRYKENGFSSNPNPAAHPSVVQHPEINPAKKKASSYPCITSPLMGTFFRSPSPSSESFVREGEKVEAGSLLCIVEAMKVMNEIRAERSCRIKKILVENGKPVTASQPLFEVEFL